MPTEALLKDILDPQKITVTCGVHGYAGNKRPPATSGCSRCWMSYYVWDLAMTAPEKRAERLDELESVIRHAVEYAQKGQFGKDLELYGPGDPRFEIKVEKDAE